MGKVQYNRHNVNYVEQRMPYLMTISEPHLSIYEVLIPGLEKNYRGPLFLSQGHLTITLISPTQMVYILAQVRKALQQTNPDYTLHFPALYSYYEMKLISFEYDRNLTFLPRFPVFIEM